MARETPFVPVAVRCPFCGQQSTQRYLKSRLYRPEITEEDSHVAVYAWENPEFAHIRPNHYHIWHCPACHFCDEKEAFRGEDASLGKLELIKEKLLNHSRLPNNMIGRLGSAVDFSADEYSVESAIAAHLLAVFQQELLSPNLRQYPKIARMYLRTAWLFRERDAATTAPAPAGFVSFEAFLESFRPDWPEIPTREEAALETALARYRDVLDRSANNDIKYDLGVMNLTVALLRRAGRHAEALRTVRGVFTAATKARQTARLAVQKNIDAARNQNLLTFLTGAIDRAKDQAEDLADLVFREELPAAREAVLQMGPADPQTVAEKLRAMKFSEITCRRLRTALERTAGGQ